MDCRFSEFSYGYACIREAEVELATAYAQAGAPHLPSLKEENKVGWDAAIHTTVDYALFLQFKRPEFVSRPHPHSPTWPHAGGPHYRIAIDSDADQHAALAQLEADIAAGMQKGDVLYVAPTFHQQSDFDAAYATREILTRSTMFLPHEFAVGSGRHYFLTVAETGQEIALSAPRRPNTTTRWRSRLAGLRQRAATWESRRGDVTLGDLEEVLMRSVTRMRGDVLPRPDAPVAVRMHQLSAMLGCGLILMTNPTRH